MAITYSLVSGDEMVRLLDPIMVANKWMCLNPNSSFAIVAMAGDKVAGFVILQNVPFCGPLYVDPYHRGEPVAGELIRQMTAFMGEIECRGCVVVAENPKIGDLCEQLKFTKIPDPVYIRNEKF